MGQDILIWNVYKGCLVSSTRVKGLLQGRAVVVVVVVVVVGGGATSFILVLMFGVTLIPDVTMK